MPWRRGRSRRRSSAPDTFAQFDALHPVGHVGEISDIAGAIMHLESAPFVTGEILHVDGGQSAGLRKRS